MGIDFGPKANLGRGPPKTISRTHPSTCTWEGDVASREWFTVYTYTHKTKKIRFKKKRREKCCLYIEQLLI